MQCASLLRQSEGCLASFFLFATAKDLWYFYCDINGVTIKEELMNRTALCIRMLALLKVRGRMRIDEIAEALETNPRNVRESNG